MFNLSPKSSFPLSNKGIQVNALRFIPSHGNNYISIYAQYSNCKDWVPISIGLSAIPSLQQVRDIDRNISLNTGSYENAHFYLRSADGNNVTTAFFTNKDGGAIQSGTTTGLTALNLQPLGGVLNYGSSEVASQKWTKEQGYLKVETDPVYVASIPNILMYKGNIGASVDLNTYTITGVYVQTSDASATSGTNYPAPFAGKLEIVNQSATFIWQTYHIYGHSTPANRGIWRREYYNGTWYPWTKLADTSNTGVFELLANKATVMTTVNNTLYPTVQAIANKFYNGTTVAATQNQFFGLTDSTAYDMSPANNDWTWHDVFAFNASRYQYETTTDYGATWIANGINATAFKQLTQQKQATGAVTLTNTPGVPNGIRCTFIGVAFSNLGHVILGMLYQATQCNVDVTIESSPDNVVWTNLFTKTNVSLLNSAAGNIFRLNSAIATTYIRITITVNSASVAASTAIFTSLRGMALRGGNQGFGKEFEYPYNWTEDKYMRFTAPTYTGTGVLPTQYKLALLDTNNGNQLTMTDLGSALNGSFIQNQTATLQTANARVSGYLQGNKLYAGTGSGPGASVIIVTDAPITGGTTAHGVRVSSTIQSDVTVAVNAYSSNLNTAATAFTLSSMRHFYAQQGTIGAGSSIGTQAGFMAEASLTGANLNIGFLGALPSNGTSSYNLYMSGSAPNYIAGRLGLNTTALTNVAFRNSLAISGNPSSYGAFFDTQIASDVTSSATVYASAPYTPAAAFTVGTLTHFAALQGVIGAGSAISIQNGFTADSTMIGAANNYGFRGRVPSGTSNWNLYMDGSANNFLASRLGIGTTALSNCIVHITTPVTGATTMYTHLIESRASADVTGSMFGYVTSIGVLDAFTLGTLVHYHAQQGIFGTGTVTSQTGFNVSANMISGTSSNYAFKGSIPTGISSNWNLYMDGSAPNYLAGRLGIGTTNMNSNVHISLPLTGSTLFYNVNADGLVQSDITSIASYFRTAAQTAAATFTVGTINHFDAQQGIFGAGSTVSNQIGFTAGGNLIGATNNYGFYGGIPAGTNRWNLYMAGTAQNYMAGNLSIGVNNTSTNILNVNIGVVTGATVLGNFSQNGGSIQLQNGTTVAAQFTPVFKGVAVGNNGYGVGIIAQGFDAYNQAAIVLSGRNTSGTGVITSGKLFSVQNYTTEYLSIDYVGFVTISNLAGAGTRVVTASPSGVLGTTALTNGTVTNVTGTTNRITVATGTTTPVIDIATTYAGQTSITTLGTITTGAWNGAVIGTSYGGTGASALTGLVVGNGASPMTAIAGAANQLLRRNPANTAYEFFTPTYLTATPNLQAVATAGNAFLGDLILGNIPGSAVNIGSGPGGGGNTRVGTNALGSNVNGDWNVAIGFNSLSALTTSVNNTAIGENTATAYTGVGSIGNNTWVGNSAGQGMTGGTDNLLVGALAGYVGVTDRNRGDGNIMIGRNAGNSIGTSGTGALGSYNVFMGYNAGLGSAYGLLSNRLIIGNVLNTGVDLPIIEGNMTVGAAALTVNASFKATGAAFLMSGTNTNSILPATGTDLDIQSNNGNTNIYGVVHLKATPASSGEEMLIVDTTGKIGTAAIPGFNPPAGVTLTSSTNIIVSEVSACTDKYGRVRITTSASSPQYDVVVFIKYSVPYSVDAKATINYANGEIAASMMIGGSNFYYIIDNDASGFRIFFKEIPSKVPFMIDYNVVGY